MTKHTSRDLRIINRQRILQLSYFHAPIDRLGLSRLSGLSPATVTTLVGELIEENIIHEAGAKESFGGRPSINLMINPTYGYFLGVELGETIVHVDLFDMTFQRINGIKYALAGGENRPEEVLKYMIKGVQCLLVEAGLTQEQILGMGIGVPGIVDSEGTISVFAPNWGWHDVSLLERLKHFFTFPIFISNGAQAMALAEMWFGAGRTHLDMVALLLGTGVGAGMIAGGMLYRGSSNSAGEWGHTTLQIEGRPCHCGSRGCVETYIGAPGIVQTLRELAPESPLLEEDDTATLQALHTAAEANDPVALRVIERTSLYLGAGIANLINLVNPPLVVIGGWVGILLSTKLLSKVEPVVSQYAMQSPLKGTHIAISQLDGDSVSLGAASLALSHFLQPDADEPLSIKVKKPELSRI